MIDRRVNKLNVKLNEEDYGDDIVLAVDASGIKVANRGDWIRRKWKVKRILVTHSVTTRNVPQAQSGAIFAGGSCATYSGQRFSIALPDDNARSKAIHSDAAPQRNDSVAILICRSGVPEEYLEHKKRKLTIKELRRYIQNIRWRNGNCPKRDAI